MCFRFCQNVREKWRWGNVKIHDGSFGHRIGKVGEGFPFLFSNHFFHPPCLLSGCIIVRLILLESCRGEGGGGRETREGTNYREERGGTTEERMSVAGCPRSRDGLEPAATTTWIRCKEPRGQSDQCERRWSRWARLEETLEAGPILSTLFPEAEQSMLSVSAYCNGHFFSLKTLYIRNLNWRVSVHLDSQPFLFPPPHICYIITFFWNGSCWVTVDSLSKR